jgi:outer membrane protein insertion porin family
MVTGGAELNFPIYGEGLRGVVFTEGGTFEDNFKFGTIRTSVGAGVRWTLPFFGQVPLAFDFAFPITKSREDDVRYFSFSLGI